jgi:hypothetical protein
MGLPSLAPILRKTFAARPRQKDLSACRSFVITDDDHPSGKVDFDGVGRQMTLPYGQ